MKTKILLALGLFGMLLLPIASDVSAGDVNPAAEPAIQNLATCLATKLDLEAVILIDESVSLRKTDPEGRREALAKDIISAFGSAALQTVDGVNPRLDVLVVGFGSDLTNVLNTPLKDEDWVTLSDSTTPDLLDKLVSFKDRHNDRDTDYVDALQGASRRLGEHASEMKKETGIEPCRVVVWFTDGKFDIERASAPRAWAPNVKNPDQAEVAGRQLLCGADGIANSLRLQQTYLLTVALISNEFKVEDSSLLKKITLGGDCGVESADGLGFYREGTNFDQIRSCLSLALNGFLCGNEPPLPCTSGGTGACVQTIEVTSTDVRVTGVVIANSLTGELSLKSPSGETVVFTNGRKKQSIGDATFEYTGNEGIYNFTIDLKDSDRQATGTWTFLLSDDPQGTLDLEYHKIPGFKFELSAPQETELKKSIEVVINLLGRDGQAANLPNGFVGTFRPRVARGDDLLADPSFKQVVIENGKSATFTVTPQKGGGSIIKLVVDATVSSNDGTLYKLTPKEIEIRIIDPGLPVIPVASIDFGFIGAELADKENWATPESPKALPFTKTIQIVGFRGATTGDSSICLNQPVGFSTLSEMETTMSLVGGENIDGQDGCVLLSANEEKVLEFQLSALDPISGSLVGSSEFTITNLSTADSSVINLPVEAQIDVPVPPLKVDSTIVIREFLIALLVVVLLYVLASLILAVLWRTSNRRTWEFRFEGLDARTYQSVSSAVESRKGFIQSDGNMFVRPWNAVTPGAGLRLRARPNFLGLPKVNISGNNIRLSSGTVGTSLGARVHRVVSPMIERVTRRESTNTQPAQAAVVDQPLTNQWVLVNLKMDSSRKLSGTVVLFGPLSSEPNAKYADRDMDIQIRKVLLEGICNEYGALRDKLVP